MAEVQNLIEVEEVGTLRFGNDALEKKTKLDGFEFQGDQYKVKTFSGITKLEKNGMFVYESVPGTVVSGFSNTEEEVSFQVSGRKDAQITLGMEADSSYNVIVDGVSAGDMDTNLSGKLSVSLELEPGKSVSVKVVKK